VTNSGDYRGAEVVQLYLSDEDASLAIPKQALKAFQRVELWPGASQEVQFTLTPKMMEMINENGEGIIEPGSFTAYVGGSSPSSRLEALGNIPMVKARFEVQ
ncbi:MAG: fibronectin type III-like domain-contianing protein, partial [Bacteroidota bacterium]